jgi:hypothetical protein
VKRHADGGRQGAKFQNTLNAILERGNVEIVKPSDQAQRFVASPKRWIVQSSLPGSDHVGDSPGIGGLQWRGARLRQLAPIRLMMRKSCNPT